MKGRNICLLFGLYLKEEEQNYYESCKTLQNAANALQWSFVEGLKQYQERVTILNMPMIPSYPDYTSISRLRGFDFEISSNIKGVNLPYYNLIYYKYYSMFYYARKNLKKWIKQDVKNRVVIVYGQYAPWLSAAYSVKKSCPELKIVNIIPDVPQYMGFGRSLRYRFLRTVNKRFVEMGKDNIDAYVLLSKYMVETIPIDNKPWIVIEGIYNNKYTPKQSVSIPDVFNTNKKIVFYSGDLTDIYGVKDLVNAFHRTTNDNYSLVICGKGNSQEFIENMAKIDSRITYLGLVERDKVLFMQEKATLLVNPRDASGEFTKYSFPSKTMEYFSSGTPVLMCKLPGVPDEYFKHCFSCEKITEDVLLKMMQTILCMEDAELKDKGKKAQDFILNCKNPKVQCKKLISLIENLH